MDQVDVLVVGAGVVGLAVARALALRGREVMVLDRADAIGTETSSRNSEVIHAGIYYPAGSLKARLCVQGKTLLYRYCQERSIAHQACGKLIVATTARQREALPDIIRKAQANGVDDLTLLSPEQAMALEPALSCMGAVLSPSTGIVDSHALMLSLQGDLEHHGGMVACHAQVVSMQAHQQGVDVHCTDMSLRARLVVNAAGLGAVALAQRISGLAAEHVPTAFCAKGSYFSLAGRSPFSRLIYPAPEPDRHLAGLGVHLTLDMGGQAKFGPDVQWVQDPADLAVDPDRASQFSAEIRRYWPSLPDGVLLPGYAGIRPKISGPDAPAADFRVDGQALHGIAGLINLFGIESPGLTSCLAIGDHVASMADAQRVDA